MKMEIEYGWNAILGSKSPNMEMESKWRMVGNATTTKLNLDDDFTFKHSERK